MISIPYKIVLRGFTQTMNNNFVVAESNNTDSNKAATTHLFGSKRRFYRIFDRLPCLR